MFKKLFNLLRFGRKSKKVQNAKSVAGLLMELKRGLKSERLAMQTYSWKEAKRINSELIKMIESVNMKGVV